MNDPLGIDPGPPNRTADRPIDATPLNWKSAIAGLVSSRLAILQAESQEASRAGIKKIVAFIAAAILLLFAWGLALAGGIAAIATGFAFPWYWVALIVCALHVITAVILVTNAKSTNSGFFPVTRSEFKKDREWLENFQNRPK